LIGKHHPGLQEIQRGFSATKLVLLAVELNFQQVLPHASVLMMMIVKEGTQQPATTLQGRSAAPGSSSTSEQLKATTHNSCGGCQLLMA
jgi:hypothetical protein